MQPLELITPRKRSHPKSISHRSARIFVDTKITHLDQPYTYAIPKRFENSVTLGSLVRVPFSGRIIDGLVIEILDETAGNLKEIKGVTFSDFLNEKSIHKLEIIQNHYLCNLWDLIRNVFPKPIRNVTKSVKPQAKSTREIQPEFEFRINEIINSNQKIVRLIDSYTKCFDEIVNCIEVALRNSHKTLVLLPEVADIEKLISYFPDALQLHGNLSSRDRFANYLSSPEANLIVGTRTAIFLPFEPNVIISWDLESHSFQEAKFPYWHTTRVIELLEKEVAHISFAFSLPLQNISDIAEEKISVVSASTNSRRFYESNDPGRIPTKAWELIKKSQGSTLIVVARTGFSPSLICRECKNTARCKCGGGMIIESSHAIPICDLCDKLLQDWQCIECQSKHFLAISSGTDRTAFEIGRAFPGKKIHISTGEKRFKYDLDNEDIVVATPGAIPIPTTDYEVVILLDGTWLAARPSLDAFRNLRRIWLKAISFSKPNAHIFSSLPLNHDVMKYVMRPADQRMILRDWESRTSAHLPPAYEAVIFSPGLNSKDLSAMPTEVDHFGNQGRMVFTTKGVLPRDTIKRIRDRASIEKKPYSIRIDPFALDDDSWSD